MNRPHLLIVLVLSLPATLVAQQTDPGSEVSTKQVSTERAQGQLTGRVCLAVDRFFKDEVWVKVGNRVCLNCHQAGGDAAESGFVLRDPSEDWRSRDESHRHNRAQFARVALKENDGASLLLQKVLGDVDHGGGQVLEPQSTGWKVLKRFRSRLDQRTQIDQRNDPIDKSNFFDGVEMSPPKRLLRRLTLSLAGRLPTPEEQDAVTQGGLDAVREVLRGVMDEDAFYERLSESFNDILLTRGYDGVAEGALSYEHFKSRLWYQELDPNKGRKGDERLKYSHPLMKEHYKRVNDYREAMRREPTELVSYLVRNQRPITELVTANYTMLSPYTARGYGMFEELKDQFKDPDDPFEFIPVTLPALVDRSGRQQESRTGDYPHSGLLTSFQYLKRYPTTETNRNRLRVRMVFLHFLGIDVMELAPRVNDAAAVTAQYEVPTMQASDCVVCHKIIDPIAGLYQDYYVVDGKGIFGPRKEGWYKDIFAAGWKDERLPDAERWRSVQWLGERTAADPRFATAMVSHVWYTLTGRRPLLPPDDIDDPLFDAKRRAYQVQRDEMERVASKLIEGQFNLRIAFEELALSKLYRVDGISTGSIDAQRIAELDDLGVVRLLSPEQLERKIHAIFGSRNGKSWNRLTDREAKLNILYGGIDSKEVTERNLDPSGAMGAIQRILANEISCRHVAHDFSLPPQQRRLFPEIEPDVVPGASPQADQAIRQAIVHLHHLVLGTEASLDAPEVERTFALFSGIVEDAKSREGISPREHYSCQTEKDSSPPDPDPHYTLRAWRAVVTYLLRQHSFLYE